MSLAACGMAKDDTPTPVNASVKSGKVRLRTIKTRTGHTIQFIEEDGAGIHIETKGGHKIHLDDSGQQYSDQFNRKHDDRGEGAAMNLKATSININATTSINIDATAKSQRQSCDNYWHSGQVA